MKITRQAIVTQLKTICPRVYFLNAPDTAQFPYLVYEIEITDLGDNLQLVTLDVDGWDNDSDTTTLENLMSTVGDAFNRKMIINNDLYLSFYIDRKIPLIDQETQLNRRKYIFNARLYERNDN